MVAAHREDRMASREFSLCKFQVRVALPHNFSIKIAGSISELGDWKAEAGVPMQESHEEHGQRVYEAAVHLPRDWPFEYKYVMINNENPEEVIWNDGDNHKRTVSSDIGEVLFEDIWQTGPNRFKNATDGTALISVDSWLEPYENTLRGRYSRYKQVKENIQQHGGGLHEFSKGYLRYGLNYDAEKHGYHYREWAPNAQRLSLIGDFNHWDANANPMERSEFGDWYCFVSDLPEGGKRIGHGSRIKCAVTGADGKMEHRIPCWAPYAVQQVNENSLSYCGVHWDPDQKYKWRTSRKKIPDNEGLRIYEAHVGMAGVEGRVHSYKEFTDNVLPRIHHQGYNCIQLMAIMEHAYYGSFGYHVTNFFAVSSRCGTPDDLKALVDRAHELGMWVIMDIVHSHASTNVLDGINMFDGTDAHYFHGGPRGKHELWDSRIFNYGNFETIRFLLSNCRWWVEEYGFDGYRFDGVTSMLYLHHGIGFGFSGDYGEYFSDRSMTDDDAIVYLQLANELLHTMDPPAITIAEDVSGMPGLCRPVKEGGVGFDYRLAMAVPDMWIKLLKESSDEKWDLSDICWTLTNRRYTERTITYAESHDQALVGDKTLAFWLMDADMYTGMSTVQPLNAVVDRGIALHKMIRSLTFALGGEAWLNFIGNEFGHPEWIDFPREGNNWSYHNARRQWNLVDDPLLRYQHLNNWDREMNMVDKRYNVLLAKDTYISLKHEEDKVIVFEKAGLIFVFNFHTHKSYTDYAIGVNIPGKYMLLTDSDRAEVGGHQRLDRNVEFFTRDSPHCNRNYSMQVYIPCRTVAIYHKIA